MEKIVDFQEIYKEYVIDQLILQDKENYLMYKNSGLTDSEIYEIVTAPSMNTLYDFNKDLGV